MAREHGDTTPYGDSPLATSSFRVYHLRRMSNAIVVAASRAIERYPPSCEKQWGYSSKTVKTVCFQPRFKNSAKTLKNSGRGGSRLGR